jgi:hypothetical protein
MGGHKDGPEAISEHASRNYETVYFYQLIFKQFILWKLLFYITGIQFLPMNLYSKFSTEHINFMVSFTYSRKNKN